MPRGSVRKRVIFSLHKLIQRRKQQAVKIFLMEENVSTNNGAENNNEDALSVQSDNTIDDLVDAFIEQSLDNIVRRRYFIPRTKYRTKKRSPYGDVFQRDLNTGNLEDGTPPWLTEEEFLQKYRVHRESFHSIFGKIQQHPVFHQQEGKCKQEPVCNQLLVFLYYLGTSGSGASNPRCRNIFGIGRGTAQLYRYRVTKAIRSLHDKAVYWPDEDERAHIVRRIGSRYEWYNCIAIADGTLFPLTYEPQSEDAPDYHGRKFAYSISTMIVNDDQKKSDTTFLDFLDVHTTTVCIPKLYWREILSNTLVTTITSLRILL
jgi:hypothetical protein